MPSNRRSQIRVLVCGGRDYTNRSVAYMVLDSLKARARPGSKYVIVHGDARGADTLAKEWAEKNGIEHVPYPADWNKHGRSAGPIRNREMLKSGIDFAIAFPGGRGTADMVSILKASGIPVWEIP